jgi:hypothetical protein
MRATMLSRFRFRNSELCNNSALRLSGDSHRFTLAGWALPPGFTLDPNTGQIFGTPTAVGIFQFQAIVVSRGGAVPAISGAFGSRSSRSANCLSGSVSTARRP